MFLKNALAYSGTNIISQMAIFIQGFILRRMLPPEIMGLWNFAGVARNLSSSFTINVLAAARRELPLLRGKNDEKAQQDCRSVTLTYTLAEIACVSIGVVMYTTLVKKGVSPAQFLALLATAVLIIFVRFQESYITFFQGAQLYVPLSRILFVNSLILAVALPLGAVLMGIWGVFAGALLAEGTKVLWMIAVARRLNIRPRLQWDKGIFQRLASYSVWYRIADYPFVMFGMMDVLWVTKFMGLAALGVYSFARGFFLQGSEITVRIGTVFFTRLLEQFGRGEEKEKIAGDLNQFILFQLLVAIPIVCWALSCAVPFLIYRLTPLYAGGIVPFCVLLIASFYDPNNHLLSSLWLAEKRLVSYGKANAVGFAAMLVSFIMCWFGIGRHTLSAVAAAVVCGYFVTFSYMVFTIGRELLGMRRAVKLYLRVCAASLWTEAVIMYFALHFHFTHALVEDIRYTLEKAMLSFVLISPVIFMGLKDSVAGTILMNRWRSFKASVKT